MSVHSFCSFISTSSLAQQLMCSLLCAHVHVRDGRSSFKVYANFCNCLFVRTHSLFLNGRANAAEIFRFYGTYICQSHTICKDLFPSHTHTHAHIRSRSLCFCLSPPSDPVFPARQFLPLPRSLSASICTVHSFVRFFASAKIFNLNMYNASKKLPSTSINIDRLTVSGIHLKDLSRKIPKHSRVHLAAWIPYYSLSISSVSVSSIRVYVSMCEVVCVCFKCVLRKAERILSHICLGRRSSSSYFARCS